MKKNEAKQDERSSSLSTSSQLHISWLAHEIIVDDFVPEGEFLISTFHSHSTLELLLIVDGEGTMLVQGSSGQQLLPLRRGSVVFINQKIAHRITEHEGAPLRTYLLSFTVEACPSAEKIAYAWIEYEQRVVQALLSKDYACSSQPERTDACITELERILQSVASRRLGELVIIKNRISNVMMSAFQLLTDLPPRDDFDTVLSNISTLTISSITSYVQAHFTENITLTSVAEHFFYSPRQCQRIIREKLGVSFTYFLADIRLAQAKELLRTTDESIEKIAERSGLRGSKSLSRLMQQRDGVTPYRYRKLCRDAVQNAASDAVQTSAPELSV